MYNLSLLRTVRPAALLAYHLASRVNHCRLPPNSNLPALKCHLPASSTPLTTTPPHSHLPVYIVSPTIAVASCVVLSTKH